MAYIVNKYLDAKHKVLEKSVDKANKKGDYVKADKLQKRLEKFDARAYRYILFEGGVSYLLDKANWLPDDEHKKETYATVDKKTNTMINKASVELKTAEVLLGVVIAPVYGAVYGALTVHDNIKEKPIVDEVVKVIETAQDMVPIDEKIESVKGTQKSAHRIKDGVLLVRYNNKQGNDRFAIIHGQEVVAVVGSKQGIKRVDEARKNKVKEIQKAQRQDKRNATISALQQLQIDR